MMVTLANHFAGRGITTDLVVASYEGTYCGDVASAVRVVDLETSRTLTSVPHLVRYLLTKRPDALLSTLMYVNVIAACAHFLAQSKARLVFREANIIAASEARRHSIKGRWIQRLAPWAYRYADAVIGVSAGVTDDIVNVLGVRKENVETIYNPVGEDVFQKATEEVRNGLPGPPVVLGVGRLAEQKGFDTLIRAFAQLRKRREASLLILGEGEQREMLEKLARELSVYEDVSMPGFVENPFAYMRAANVFVLSSRWEGCPNVLLEAMASGAPVISTDCPSGPAEILENGEWGRLVGVDRVVELAAAMEESIETSDHPDVESRARTFGVENTADQYLDVLESKD